MDMKQQQKMETTDHLFESIHCVYSNKSHQNTNIPATTVDNPNTVKYPGIWVANIKYRILSNTAKYYMGTSLNAQIETSWEKQKKGAPSPCGATSGLRFRRR